MHATSRFLLERFMHIDRALRSGKWPNAPQLALQLEVNVRAIYRDLQFLRDRLHAPIVHDANHS